MSKSIRTKLLSLIALAFFITVLGVIGLVVYLSDDIAKEVAGIVDSSQVELYSQRINAIIGEIEQAYRGLRTVIEENSLAGTDMARDYELEAQDTILKALRKKYYEGKDVKDSNIYPFIVDFKASIILHPLLPHGDMSLSNIGLANMMNEAKESSFIYRHNNLTKWVFIRKFEPWKWVVAYSVPEDIKYAGVYKVKGLLEVLRNRMVLVIGILTVLILFCLAWFISHFVTTPLSEVIGGLHEASDQVTSASDRVSDSSQRISEQTMEQASSFEEISSCLIEINAMTHQNAENADNANKLAQEAYRGAEDGNASMKEMQIAVSAINESSSKISSIISSIEEIAFQTNLLALNAAVEAARAGEYGRGFAIVAEEVRRLANRSSEAAKDTVALIQENVDNAKSGTQALQKSQNILQQISESSKKVAGIISSMAGVSQAQASGISQVTSAVERVNQITQSNSSSAEQTANLALSLNEQAKLLQNMIDKLQGLVGGRLLQEK